MIVLPLLPSAMQHLPKLWLFFQFPKFGEFDQHLVAREFSRQHILVCTWTVRIPKQGQVHKQQETIPKKQNASTNVQKTTPRISWPPSIVTDDSPIGFSKCAWYFFLFCCFLWFVFCEISFGFKIRIISFKN